MRVRVAPSPSAGQGAHYLTTIVEDVDPPAWCVAFRGDGGRVAATVVGGRVIYAGAVAARLAVAIGNEGALTCAARAGGPGDDPMPGGMELPERRGGRAVAVRGGGARQLET